MYCHYSLAISFSDLDRDKMIALAYLTGSDYTEGVHGMLNLFLYGFSYMAYFISFQTASLDTGAI